MMRFRKSGGFTMVELFVVSLILGILLGIALPKYGAYMTSQSLLGLHNAIVAKLREAPGLSKALRKPVYGVIDLDNEKVWLEVDGVVYGAKVPSISNTTAEISGIADNDAAVAPPATTTGLAKYRFDYWGTVTDTPAQPSYTIHVGLKSMHAAYVAGGAGAGKSEDFRSITMLQLTGRASAYSVGCFGSTHTAFGTPDWPQCSNL